MRASTSRNSSGVTILLVEDDDVRESDLILRFGRILEPVRKPFGVSDGHNRVECA